MNIYPLPSSPAQPGIQAHALAEVQSVRGRSRLWIPARRAGMPAKMVTAFAGKSYFIWANSGFIHKLDFSHK